MFGHARLVGYDTKLNLVPDILASFDVQEGRIFTLRIRKGHRWSDGEPFTSEDFRFYWEDVANDRDVAAGRPRGAAAGARRGAEGRDRRRAHGPLQLVASPNPLFLPALAATTAVAIYRPAHYLKQFHRRYADPDDWRS